MKKINKYISIIISVIISLLLIAPVAMAGDPVGIDAKGTCYSTLGEDVKTGLATGQMIATEIEAGLVQSEEIGGATVKTCYRVTTCRKDEGVGGSEMCLSFINKECNLNGLDAKVTTVKIKEKDKDGNVTSKDVKMDESNELSCEKMQLIISPAGTGLIYAYIGMVYKWAASIVGIIAVLIVVVSGIQIAAAGGDPGKVDEAKGRIIRALSGIAVLFLSGLLLYTINPTFFIK